MSKKIVRVSDKMQTDYRYELSEPLGQNFDPLFQPELSPAEMLALGVFGGVYLRDCRDEFPASWFQQAKLAPEGTTKHLAELNYFGVNASQPLAVWRAKGWINEAHDPRGWFQWYCRYYLGRRLPAEDQKQIKRWRAIRRHLAQIQQHCRPSDQNCRPKQKQALLHWAYDTRKI